MFFYFDSSLALIGLAGMLYQSHDVRDPGANILVVILTVALSVSISGHASYTYENCGTFWISRYGSTVFIALGDVINLSACFYALWELSVRSANGIHHVLPLVIWTFGAVARMYGDFGIHERLKDQWVDSMTTPLSDGTAMSVSDTDEEDEDSVYDRQRQETRVIRDDPFSVKTHQSAFVIHNDDQDSD